MAVGLNKQAVKATAGEYTAVPKKATEKKDIPALEAAKPGFDAAAGQVYRAQFKAKVDNKQKVAQDAGNTKTNTITRRNP